MTLLSDDEAARIGRRAATLWERLCQRGDSQAVCPAVASEDVKRRLERWRQVVAKGDEVAFRRRLAWDGVTWRDAERALASADAPTPRPPWLGVFLDLIRSVEDYRLDPPGAIARDPARPRPFEDLLFPLVHGARRRLARRMATASGVPGGPGGALFSQGARAALEMGLLDRLSRVAAPCTHSSAVRAPSDTLS
jgi:hypothetical protein